VDCPHRELTSHTPEVHLDILQVGQVMKLMTEMSSRNSTEWIITFGYGRKVNDRIFVLTILDEIPGQVIRMPPGRDKEVASVLCKSGPDYRLVPVEEILPNGF
jgi:hypothetical protein